MGLMAYFTTWAEFDVYECLVSICYSPAMAMFSSSIYTCEKFTMAMHRSGIDHSHAYQIKGLSQAAAKQQLLFSLSIWLNDKFQESNSRKKIKKVNKF